MKLKDEIGIVTGGARGVEAGIVDCDVAERPRIDIAAGFVGRF